MMHMKVDESFCIGCGICQRVCPDGFEIRGGKARIKDEKAGCIEQAARSCPRGAIKLENGKESIDTSPQFTGNMHFGRHRGMGNGRGRGGGRRRRSWL
ncbi:MAG: ferredoxin [Candidatus Micrarchaeota archaeon]|nr:ferredoxin [Candidatus Micrarchaeota archaeon]